MGIPQHWIRFSVYVKVILITTLVLNAAAVVAILILGFNNPSTLGALDGLGNKLLAA